MAGCSLADGGDGPRLNGVPLLRVFELRLVQHLEEDLLRIRLRVMAGERAPQRDEPAYCIIFAAKVALELIRGMHVDNHAQPVLEHRVYCGVELGNEGWIQAIRRGAA